MPTPTHTTNNTHHQPTLHLDVTLDDADLWGAIEWTLATARRTGLALDRLDVAAPRSNTAAPGRLLRLRVSAPDDSLLGLFVRRLRNGVDVRDVQCDGTGATPARTKETHERALPASLAAVAV